MELIGLSISSVLKLAVTGAIGFAFAKIKILGDKEISALSTILKEILICAMLISVGFKEYSLSLAKGILYCFIWSFIAQFAGLVIAWLVIPKRNNQNWQIERASCCVSNVGFIGTAIVGNMLSENAMIYMVGAMASCNIILWTFGDWIMSDSFSKDGLIKFLKSKVNICMIIGIALYLLHPSIPSFISDPITSVGAMTGNVAMIVSGATLAKANIFKLLKSFKTYLIMLNRLIISPLVVIPLVLLAPGVDPLVGITCLVSCACPIPSIVTIFSVTYNKDSAYASALLALSLILCIFTIPLMVSIYSLIVV